MLSLPPHSPPPLLLHFVLMSFPQSHFATFCADEALTPIACGIDSSSSHWTPSAFACSITETGAQKSLLVNISAARFEVAIRRVSNGLASSLNSVRPRNK